jgi:putative DNA primase/helicase
VAARKAYPKGEIVICCDNDRTLTPNIGVVKGRAAAIAASAKIIIPEFPEDAPPELTDFNDLENWTAGGAA